MSDQDVFQQATTTTTTDQAVSQSSQTEDTNSQVNQLPTEVLEFVGEGKKYSNVTDALKSVPHAQKHIADLEAELAELRRRSYREDVADEILNQMKAVSQQQKVDRPTDETGQLSATAIKELAAEAVKEIAAKNERESNISKVNAQLTELYGDKASEQLANKASELGVSVSFLQQLAAQSPKAFMAQFQTTTPSTTTSTQSSVNTESFTSNNSQSGEKTFAYYQKLKKEDNRKFLSQSVQAEMHAQAVKLGEKFYQ